MSKIISEVTPRMTDIAWDAALAANEAFDDWRGAQHVAVQEDTGIGDDTASFTLLERECENKKDEFEWLCNVAGPVVLHTNSPFRTESVVPVTVQDRESESTKRGFSILRTVLMAYRRREKRIGNCQLEPTCSAYGLEAIEKYGDFPGTIMAFARTLRCDTGRSGPDPVPVLERWRPPTPEVAESEPTRIQMLGYAAIHAGITVATTAIFAVSGLSDTVVTAWWAVRPPRKHT